MAATCAPAAGSVVEISRAALACLEAGDLKTAETLQLRAIAVLKSDGEPGSKLAEALNFLGEMYHKSGNLQKAQSVLERAMRLAEIRQDATLMSVLRSLGSVSYTQKKYDKAERMFSRAMSVWEACCANDLLAMAHLLNNAAVLNAARGKHGRAVADFERAIPLYERSLGPNHPALARALNNCADLYVTLGDSGKAEALFSRAVEIWKRAGPTHPDHASVLGNFGVFIAKLGRHAEAEQRYRESLEILRACCGEEHPEFVRRLADHAEILRRLGDKRSAGVAAARAAALRDGQPRTTPDAFTVDVQDLSKRP